MGIQYTGIAFLAITVFILVISPVSSSRHIHRFTVQDSNQRFQSQHNSAAAAAPKESRNDKIDPITGVSQRVIPGGPNPLHN
ncbi:hypothetical protein HanRHA438_Chr07g0291871 [Helianthus annuus]|nr:hypothetical protein HanIR_Chr07g0303041 [Helianthus annuus]KAJ0906846.1 hypothetical protein HanRHA438_Chr07g0291871 [Helianthus annuus]